MSIAGPVDATLRDRLSRYHFIRAGDEGIIFSPTSHHIHVLNHMATFIWLGFIEEERSIEDLSRDLGEIYSLPKPILEEDILQTIRYWDEMQSKEPYNDSPRLKQPTVCDRPPAHPDRAYVELPNLTLEITGFSSALLAPLREMLSSVSTTTTKPVDHVVQITAHGAGYKICWQGHDLETASCFEHIPAALHRAVGQIACEHEDWLSILHAGAVIMDDQVLVFPAKSGSGKTTLMAALGAGGLGVLSDDAAPLTRDLTIAPLPIGMCIKEGAWKLLEPYYPDLRDKPIHDRIGAPIKYLLPSYTTTKPQHLRVDALIVPTRTPGRTTAQLSEISPIEAFSAIVSAESLLHKPLRQDDLQALLDWLSAIQRFRLDYESLEGAIRAIRGLRLNSS